MPVLSLEANTRQEMNKGPPQQCVVFQADFETLTTANLQFQQSGEDANATPPLRKIKPCFRPFSRVSASRLITAGQGWGLKQVPGLISIDHRLGSKLAVRPGQPCLEATIWTAACRQPG
ncbi:uncharacterized protein UTRI_04278 [Ustilago trichophora]|uniref:Uncharacterized protein n=1 Tax=Ustilago trichophora TaxID=86804 RepID=A0A5C3EPG4_9BASI|nr:uncharacterized protein UTRI_04278 [Ustilago trichophora]